MANFKVWCRVEEVGPQQFLATVSAIPASGEEGHVESESRVLATRATANEACTQMARAYSERLQKRGDAVIEMRA